ncbi:MAG TPA: phenylalanine 4-monooxygenase [Burkholderiales bacterium]
MLRNASIQPPKPGLRGNYDSARRDYTVAQDWGRYSQDEHALWQMLYTRQQRLVARYACAEFITALTKLDTPHGIPRFDQVNRKLRHATGWEIVAVPGLIPDREFFQHLAHRRFPVTVWLRTPQEFDYIVEPDLFHDFFGHVPLLFDGVYAEHLQAYGQGGLKALPLDGLTYLARLYWHTIEFGLVRTPDGVRAYGAGLLSSSAELPYAINDAAPPRIAFDLLRVMRTDFRIDTYQAAYFVIDNFAQLLRDTAPDFTPYYEQLKQLPVLAPGALIPADRLLLH